jgi:hypothetical protein
MEQNKDGNQATDTRGPVLHNPFYHQLSLGEVGRRSTTVVGVGVGVMGGPARISMPVSSISGLSGHLENEIEEVRRERWVGGGWGS